jgi:6-phosphogluconate dehydrogenase
LINLSILKPKYCFGIYINRHQVAGILAEQNGDLIKPVNSYVAEDSQDIFNTKNNEKLKSCLGHVLDEFGAQFKGQYIPLQISLADPLVKSAVFDLEEIPAQSKAREQLIRWKFNKERHIDMGQMSLALQSMISEQGKNQIYASTTSSNVIRVISEACEQRGFVLNVLDTAINYLFNDFYKSMSGSASLLQLNQKYWALMIWDKEKRIRYVRSKWFRSNDMTRNEELKGILLDVERLLYSYSEVNEERPSMLYIEPSSYDRALLQETLLERLGDNFTFLDQIKTLASERSDDVYSMATLAARYR